MIKKVGVIGVGIIGKPIAQRLVQAGYEVAVHDVRSEPVAELAKIGAIACGSSAEVAARSECIISLVMDVAQTDDVVSGRNGIIHTLKPGSLFVTGSTLGPAPVLRIAAQLAARGCDTIDMPITGGYVAAYEGKLALMIGADEKTLERALPLFRGFATTITRAGGIGAGQSAKLAHQLILSLNVMALLEGLSLGVAGGVEPEVLRQIIRDGLANSGALQAWPDFGARWKKMLEPAPPGAPLPNLRKDMHSALDLARELGVPVPLTTLASQVADAGTATGHNNPLL